MQDVQMILKIFYKEKDEWEKVHGKCTFAILDDDDDDLHLFGKHFVQTSWYRQNEEEAALTSKYVEQCIKLLNRRRLWTQPFRI